MDNILDKLFEIAAKKFSVPKTELSGSDDFFEKLHINSLQALSLLTDLEKEFRIEIPDYELQDVKTFDDLARLIQRRT